MGVLAGCTVWQANKKMQKPKAPIAGIHFLKRLIAPPRGLLADFVPGKIDGFEKSPAAALRLASGAFYENIVLVTFYEGIIIS